ncbi:hypothetical protein PGB34_06555 [Xenophilus arseniciresistens]|uniref:Uncharacterized protein n=1 Tax=Xenophilus arseniciresistens TaxID=1283306 RepID=A0AAE3N7J6_9BURK|nr:hypothetical protein [Xenophilus arseniciresistens]MDA7416023.1 hypothetical protein [Xenophilus arseniciresistens]
MSKSARSLASQTRLAESRQRLLDAMGYVPMVSNITGEPVLGRKAAPEAPRPPLSLGALPGRVRESAAARWMQRWWQHHPARDVVELGRPYLDRYAQKHPGKLVAYAAGAGAALWLAKPWRLLSTAAVLSLTLKAGTRSLVKAAARRELD